MQYEEICRRLMNCRKGDRVPGKNILAKREANGSVEVIDREFGYIGDVITIYSDGSVKYEYDNRSTIFSITQFWRIRKVIDKKTGFPREEYITDPMNDSDSLYKIPCWVYEVIEYAQNRCDNNRGTNRRMCGESYWEDDEERLSGQADNKDHISDVINKMYVSDLLKCLDRDELLVIRLRIWNGFIFEEITDIMNSFYIAESSDKRISLSGVYKIYRRALGKLQKKCEEDEKLY